MPTLKSGSVNPSSASRVPSSRLLLASNQSEPLLEVSPSVAHLLETKDAQDSHDYRYKEGLHDLTRINRTAKA